MITTVTDRTLIGGALYFEVPVAELTPADLGQLGIEPKRKVVKVKLYTDASSIPLCKDEHKEVLHMQIHPSMSEQGYCLCDHLDGCYIAYFRGTLSKDYLQDGGSLDLLTDEIRPRLLYQLAEDNDMSVFKLLSGLKDIQYHISIK
jgi:hypothetical protein